MPIHLFLEKYLNELEQWGESAIQGEGHAAA
jgi:hypothetical protein